MITGKKNREMFAKQSIVNFNKQTYKNKFLVIINHGKTIPTIKAQNNIIEIMLQKQMRLGTMRNLALHLVPPGAIWTTWDDDDWRSDDYLLTLFKAMNKDPSKRYLMYTNRLDHNINTNFSYNVEIPSGTYIFFCYKDPLMKYDDLDTKEDAITKKYILQKSHQTVIYKNDPSIYIRFIHNNNTSLYVNPQKTKINYYKNKEIYFEKDATAEQVQYIDTVKKKYYNNVK